MYNAKDEDRNKYKVTGPGKTAQVLYMNIGGYAIEPMEVFLTYEEAVLKMIQWNTTTNFIDWRHKNNQPTKRFSDIIIEMWLHCIDSLSELIMFKCLHPEQIKYLLEMGLIQ